MATIKSKAQLYSDSAGLPNPITRTTLLAHLDNMVASYEDIIQEYTTVQRNALTPFEGQKIYNTTSNRLEYYSASMWLPCSQKETVAVDCSGNPNYPEGLVGDQYIVSVAGFIGGGAGKSVYVGDLVYCIVGNAGGTEAGVGTSWAVCRSNSATDTPTLYAEVSLSSAEILALFTTPKTLVAATGAGTIILPERYIINFDWASVQYATHINLQAKMGSVSGRTIFQIDPVADKQYMSVDTGEIVSNTSLVLTVAGGNPTAGDSIMTVGVYYKVHTL
jgi:hypothetical protein